MWYSQGINVLLSNRQSPGPRVAEGAGRTKICRSMSFDRAVPRPEELCGSLLTSQPFSNPILSPFYNPEYGKERKSTKRSSC
jgi:hypothetical protein